MSYITIKRIVRNGTMYIKTKKLVGRRMERQESEPKEQ
jgi:hypothetical protein